MLNNNQHYQSVGMTTHQIHPLNSKLDTDSYIKALDNSCSYSMSYHKSDFWGEMTPCMVNIKGIGGTKQITEMGMMYRQC